jgi:hypothetical protein
MRFAILLALACCVSGCASSRHGWASRGPYEVLYESPTVQIRRGPQRIDPETGDLLITWVGARAQDGQPALVVCELTVFDDRDGDDQPDAGEVLVNREDRERTHKVLYSDVRLKVREGMNLRAQMVANTFRERCSVSWRVEVD